MQLVAHKDCTWSLKSVRDLEMHMLERIRDAADPSGHARARDRLFPSPLAEPPEEPGDEQTLEDWFDYVQPDLEYQFRSAIDTVMNDLRAAIPGTTNGETVHHLRIPNDHADLWCSALNQARLVLHSKHKLPESDEDIDTFDDWLPLLQSEIYGIIMEFLIRRVLWDA